MRTTSLLVLLLAGCSLDFDALERGRGDGGGIDAHLDGDGGVRDTGVDAPGHDAFVDRPDTSADGGIDAFVTPDVGTDAYVLPADAHVRCPVLDCNDPECIGHACDDGRVCTSGDVCTAALDCEGTPITCAPNECATMICTEPGGCHASAAASDGTLCTGGRCCYGRCSGLHESGNCAGCGLGCDEETCNASGAAACICDTNAGCPNGQQCLGGECRCTTNAQCAAGQTCASNHCTY